MHEETHSSEARSIRPLIVRQTNYWYEQAVWQGCQTNNSDRVSLRMETYAKQPSLDASLKKTEDLQGLRWTATVWVENLAACVELIKRKQHDCDMSCTFKAQSTLCFACATWYRRLCTTGGERVDSWISVAPIRGQIHRRLWFSKHGMRRTRRLAWMVEHQSASRRL